MNYLLDANTLIEAKNRYYQMEVCPGYWDWVLRSHAGGMVASITSVGTELRRGNDELAEWAKKNKALFLDDSNPATQMAFAEVANHVAASASQMKVGALEEFLSGADPWLIAKARTLGAVIVTHERFNESSRRKFLIPNVCRHFGVVCVNTFELLRQTQARFVLDPPPDTNCR